MIVVQATNCVNKGGQANINEWFIPRGGNEKYVLLFLIDFPGVSLERVEGAD